MIETLVISISVCYRYVKRCVGVFLLVDLWGFPFTTIKFGVYENTSSMLAQRGLSCKMCFYSSYLKVRALIPSEMIINIVNRTISTKFQEILNELYFAILYFKTRMFFHYYLRWIIKYIQNCTLVLFFSWLFKEHILFLQH